MGIHEWSYDNAITADHRFRVPLKDTAVALKNIKIEVELGSTRAASPKRSGASTATCRRCSPSKLCIECDACVDICPMDCITFTANGEEPTCARAEGAGAQPPRRTSTSPAT